MQSQSPGPSIKKGKVKARQGKARQGKARQGKARKGKERKGKEKKGPLLDVHYREVQAQPWIDMNI